MPTPYVNLNSNPKEDEHPDNRPKPVKAIVKMNGSTAYYLGKGKGYFIDLPDGSTTYADNIEHMMYIVSALNPLGTDD